MNTKNPGSNPMFLFEGLVLRVVKKHSRPWFVARDAVVCLGIKNISNALNPLSGDERGVYRMNTPGGPQDMSIISESGLYKLIMRSDKPAAKRFQNWVTRDVLPALRQDGMYVMGEEKVRTGEIGQQANHLQDHSLARP